MNADELSCRPFMRRFNSWFALGVAVGAIGLAIAMAVFGIWITTALESVIAAVIGWTLWDDRIRCELGTTDDTRVHVHITKRTRRMVEFGWLISYHQSGHSVLYVLPAEAQWDFAEACGHRERCAVAAARARLVVVDPERGPVKSRRHA